MREIERLRSNRKSMIVLEAASLEAATREDASQEAEQQSRQYFVLTTLLNPGPGLGTSGAPDGSERAPILLGNTESDKTLAMNFTLVEVSTAQSVAEGTATASVKGNNDVRAAADTMRFVAHQVASELRSSAPLRLD